ncbi:hypothetical protein LWE61_11975 [Sphingobium sufflavum]|nr:hypothetical protein [Sphingobium sufflavum]
MTILRGKATISLSFVTPSHCLLAAMPAFLLKELDGGVMSRRAKWRAVGLGALLAATVLWPIVGLFQGYYQSGDHGHQRPDWRLLRVVEQFRPSWIPHTGHMLIPVWPAPDAHHDKDCFDELSRRESAAQMVQKNHGEPQVSSAIGRSMWMTRDEILLSFELNAIHRLFPISFGALNGCIEGSLASPFCTRILRNRMSAEYGRERPRLEKALQETVNGAVTMACQIIDANGPLTRRLPWPASPKTD